MFSSWSACLSVLSYSSAIAEAAYQCIPLTMPVDVSVNTTKLGLGIPQTEPQAVSILQEVFSATSNLSEVRQGGEFIKRTYNISSRFCIPPDFDNGGVLEFTVHG